MPCDPINLPGGGVAILCSRGRQARPGCEVCGRPADWLCDYPTAPGKTCDAPLCAAHRNPQSRGIDYCRRHAPSLFPEDVA